MICSRSACEIRWERGRGLRGFVTRLQGLKVRPIRHSRIAKVKMLDSRQSSRLTVELETFLSRLSRHSARSAPVILVMGRSNSRSFRIMA
jgi:hypothetical protein